MELTTRAKFSQWALAVGCGLGIFLCILLYYYNRRIVSPPQPLRWEHSDWKIEDVSPGKPASHVFEITNVSSQPVKILSIKKGCNCLDVTLDVNPIPAKGTAKLTLSLQMPTRGREAGSTVVLQTDVDNQSSIEFSLYAKMAGALAIDPDQIAWDFDGNEATNKRVLLVRMDDKPLTDVAVENAPDGVTATVRQVSPIAVEVLLSTAAQPTTRTSSLVLTTNVAGRERVTVPITFEQTEVRVMPPLMLFPSGSTTAAVNLYCGQRYAVAASPLSVRIIKQPSYLDVVPMIGDSGISIKGTITDKGESDRRNELIVRVEPLGREITIPVVAYK